MVKRFVPAPVATRSAPSQPRLGCPGSPVNYSTLPSSSDSQPVNSRKRWLFANLLATGSLASLLGIGYLAASQPPAASPAVLQTAATLNVTVSALPTPLPASGPPLYTGSIQLEEVAVTNPSLRGTLYNANGDTLPGVSPLLPSLSASEGPSPSNMGAPKGAGRDKQSGISPLSSQSINAARTAGQLPIETLTTEPVRLASLSPSLDLPLGTAPAQPLQPRPQTHTFVVASGDTLGGLLDRYGIDDKTETALLKALRTVFTPRDLRAGQELTLTVNETGTEQDPIVTPLTLQLETDAGEILVTRKSNGDYDARIDGLPIGQAAQHHRAISRIKNSLYGSARAQKVPDSIIVRMMKTHAYDVDFQREIHPGDTFELFYSRGLSQGVAARGRGNLLYSSLTTSGKKRSYYRFTSKDGDTDYYNDKGVSSKKPLMRTPIDGARISSGFGMRRHPILGYSKMHTGTDFAARSGTPILAAGDGKVDFAGRNGGYGNYIRLKHENGVKTAYAHMKRFAKGMKKGKSVRQGQVIGFVGSTGRSTGPHLHYEVLINGKKRNPLKVKIAGGGRKLSGKDKKAFVAEKARIDKLRRDAPATTLVAAR